MYIRVVMLSRDFVYAFIAENLAFEIVFILCFCCGHLTDLLSCSN